VENALNKKIVCSLSAVIVSLDGDDPKNESMKQKYNVQAYPTLVYLDGTEKVLKNESGAPASLEDFENQIKEFQK
jgi:hypothetical protein